MKAIPPDPIDVTKVKVFPLSQRASELGVEETVLNPDLPPVECGDDLRRAIKTCAQTIRAARERNATVMLIYGAHMVKNGGAAILDRLMAGGWITHLATNGAGTIHDWEFAYLGRSSESVRANVATGTFGTWDETGRNIHLALLGGALDNLGYGGSLGRFILEDGVTLPTPGSLVDRLRQSPEHPLAPAWADLLQTLRTHQLPGGRIEIKHRWKDKSVLALAAGHNVPLTVHPGIGYDIIANHPMFNGAVIGRAAGLDFRLFGGSVERLDDGVVLSIGSAIMGPQVFEKSLSCVNNLRLQADRPIVSNHSLFVVDLQDGGNWDWSKGEPPKDNPAYYLRFCKSYSRMGGAMHYTQCDNVTFVHHLLGELSR